MIMGRNKFKQAMPGPKGNPHGCGLKSSVFTVPKVAGSPIKAFGDDSLNNYLWRLLMPNFMSLTTVNVK